MNLKLCALALATAACSTGLVLLAGPPGGDLAQQQPKYHIAHIPPAPVRTPEEELKTFKLPPGFHAELVAAEPAVEEPIALTFDPDGRMYVVELRGYMPDIKGTGELDPVGRIKLLESTKHDGVYDKHTTFLDKLIIPRAVALAGDGVLVAEPPKIWFCRDTTGDGVCDEKTAVFSDFGSRSPDPEHMANGMVPMMDNWYYSANWTTRFRFTQGKFLRDATLPRGQWGITQDDVGRLFFNTNGSMLRCDFVPSQYLTRNPYLLSPAGVNVEIARNTTFPSRVNPGVNRGYTADVNMQGKLQRVTASCGPTIYRAEQFPAEFRGNAFVCEPAGNLVSRQVLTHTGVAVKAKSVQHDGIDFFTSTDERFRPVNLYTGPDGCLYVIDLYHGILQHKSYLSSYLADQIEKRDLEDNDGHRGRIWRIVSDASKPTPLPRLSKASVSELVAGLSDPNGWHRDTCQRLLVERRDNSAVPLLQKLITAQQPHVAPLAKVHALWTLSGMDKLDDATAGIAVKDADPRVRVAALRVGEVLVRKGTGANLAEALPALANDPDPNVQLQVLVMSPPDQPLLKEPAAHILASHISDPVFRTAAISGAAGRELDLLETVLNDKAFAKVGRAKDDLTNDLCEAIIRGRSAERIAKLLDIIAAHANESDQRAMLMGINEAISPGGKLKSKATRHLRMPKEPEALMKLKTNSDANITKLAERIEAAMSWPDKPGDTTPPLTPLNAEQQKHFAMGQELFSQICAQCHQPTGLGLDGVAPPLVDSDWVLGTPDRLVRIALNGLHGPVKVGKKEVDLEMPGLKALNDEQVASILTYIRREWGHEADPVAVQTVEEIRKATADRGDLQWTAEELSEIK